MFIGKGRSPNSNDDPQPFVIVALFDWHQENNPAKITE
jgi:hypothetical protein